MKYLVLLVIIFVIIYLFIFDKGDDPMEVQSVFNGFVESGKKKDLDKATGYISRNYRDDYGGNYIFIKNILRNIFEKYEGLDARYKDLLVRFEKGPNDEDRAVAKLKIFVMATKGGIPVNIVGSNDDFDTVTVYLEKSSFGNWKIIKVEGLDAAEGNYY